MNKKDKNIENVSGTKMNDNVFNTKNTIGIAISANNIFVVLLEFMRLLRGTKIRDFLDFSLL